jgi:hypothetical protein
VPVKSSQQGVAWDGGQTGVGNRSVEPAGLGSGLQAELAETEWAGVGGEGNTTLGGSCVGTGTLGPALGFKVAGRMEAQVATMIQRCPKGW